MPSPLSKTHLSAKTLFPALSIVYRDVTQIELDPKNPRVHSEKQIEQIAQSIKAFGFNAPVLVNSELKAIAGHGRLAACKLLGITTVPTISLEHLTPQQIKGFAIADNRLGEIADWDRRLLAEEIKELSELKLEFSLDAIGFDIGEIDVMIDGLEKPAEKETTADAVPTIQNLVPVTMLGDLWLLGKNRVISGDPLLRETYSMLMGEKPADSVFTNPPYDALGDSFREVFVNLTNASAQCAIQIVCDRRRLQGLLAAAEHAKAKLTDLGIWVSNGAKPGFLQGNNFQLLFTFQNCISKKRNELHLKPCHSTRKDDYLPKKDPSTNTEATQFGFFETTIAMAAEAIRNRTARGQNVLDPFLGSGATLIAAEQAGRICYGIDLDPECIDITIRRWQQTTGETAVHATSNRSFSDLEEVCRGEKR
jgi:DNA modification methylase